MSTHENDCPVWSPSLSQWGPAAAGTIGQGFLWTPTPRPGLRLLGVQLVSRQAVGVPGSEPAYDVTVAPSWWVGFLDPSSDAGNNLRGGGEFVVGAGVFTDVNPVRSKVLYFREAGVKALASLTNGGKGWDWPMRAPDAPWPLLILATEIGTNCVVRVSPSWGVE